VLGSIQPQPLEHAPDGTIPLASIEAAIKPDDAHFAITRLVVMENTTGGKVLPMDYLREMRALATSRGLATHLDGARLFNAAVEVARRRRAGIRDSDSDGNRAGPDSAQAARAREGDVPLEPRSVAREICANFDSVSVCLSKGLGAPVGSLLLGSKPLIARARRWRKMLGGGMRQAGMIAAGGLYALENHLERLADDHANATRLAEGLIALGRQHGGLQADLPQTNIVFVRVDDAIAQAFADHLAAHGVRTTGSVGRYGSGLVQRWVTHLDVTHHDVDAALAIAAGFFQARR
jgi:threonine aldolase